MHGSFFVSNVVTADFVGLVSLITESRLTETMAEHEEAPTANSAINADLMNVVDLALQQAWADVRARPSMMPWETNSWLYEVLGSGVPLRQPLQINMLIPPMPVPTAATTVKAVTASASASSSGVLVMASGPAFCRAVKRLADVEWKQEKTTNATKLYRCGG